MKTNGMGRWIGLAAILLAAAVFVGVMQDPVVLTMLGRAYTASELGIPAYLPKFMGTGVLGVKIHSTLLRAYADQNNFQASEEELREYCRLQTPTAEELGTKSIPSNFFEETWAEWQQDESEAGMREFATAELEAWKYQKSFFDRYGGRVGVREMQVPLAFDAMIAYLAEREAAGDFTIHDTKWRTLFWKWARKPREPLVSEEDGRAAFAEHPAERWKRAMLKKMRSLDRKDPPPDP